MTRSHPLQVQHLEVTLPFTVNAAKTQAEFDALCALRSKAYARHQYTETLAIRLATMDAHDQQAVLLMAKCKQSGDCLGTLRVSVGTRENLPIAPYEKLGVAEEQTVAYIDRFAVALVENHVDVRRALMKAMWLVVCERQAPWVVASALAPLARLYRSVGLLPLPGATEGFLHPKLHDTAHYYMVGAPTEHLMPNMGRHPAGCVAYFTDMHHPDINFQWPPTSGYQSLANKP